MIHICNDRIYETYKAPFGWYWRRRETIGDAIDGWGPAVGPFETASDAIEDLYTDAEGANAA
jgi:hypothetical protein